MVQKKKLLTNLNMHFYEFKPIEGKIICTLICNPVYVRYNFCKHHIMQKFRYVWKRIPYLPALMIHWLNYIWIVLRCIVMEHHLLQLQFLIDRMLIKISFANDISIMKFSINKRHLKKSLHLDSNVIEIVCISVQKILYQYFILNF